MIVSDPPNCGVTYNHHYDDRNRFIIQATGVIIYDGNMFIVEAIEVKISRKGKK